MLSAAFAVSILLHAAAMFGVDFTHGEVEVPSAQCQSGQQMRDYGDGPKCYTLLHAQLSSAYAAPTPPPAPATLAPLDRLKANVRYNSNTAKYTNDTSAASLAQIVEEIKATAYNGSTIGDHFNVTAAIGSTASTSSYYGTYNIQADFTYTAKSSFSASFQSQTKTFAAGQSYPAYLYIYEALQRVYMTNKPACDTGYSYDYPSGECKLSDPAKATSGPDGICPITWSNTGTYNVNPFDPDCARVTAAGALTVSNGGATVTATAPQLDIPAIVNTTTFTRRPAGEGTRMNHKSDDNRSNVRQETDRDFDAQGKDVADIFKAPAQNSGSGTYSSVPSYVSYPAPGTSCGAPGQPPCAVQLDGEGFGTSKEDIADGVRDGLKSDEELQIGDDDGTADEAASTAHAGDSPFSTFLSFKGFALTPTSVSCASSLDLGPSSATTLNFTTGGAYSIDADFNLNKVCPLIEPHENTIRSATLALWYVAAIIALIRLTV